METLFTWLEGGVRDHSPLPSGCWPACEADPKFAIAFYRWFCAWSLPLVTVWVPCTEHLLQGSQAAAAHPVSYFPSPSICYLPSRSPLFPIAPQFFSKKSLFPYSLYWFQCHRLPHPSSLTVPLPLDLLVCLLGLSYLGWCWSNFRSNFIFVTFCMFCCFLRSEILLNWCFLIRKLRLLIKILLFPTSRHDFLL